MDKESDAIMKETIRVLKEAKDLKGAEVSALGANAMFMGVIATELQNIRRKLYEPKT